MTKKSNAHSESTAQKNQSSPVRTCNTPACCNDTQSTTLKGKTRITIKYDVGFHNTLFIRGQGINGMSWDRGTPLKNVKADEWVWETDNSFANAEFKVLINDRVYEVGTNHTLKCGANFHYSPRF